MIELIFVDVIVTGMRVRGHGGETTINGSVVPHDWCLRLLTRPPAKFTGMSPRTAAPLLPAALTGSSVALVGLVVTAPLFGMRMRLLNTDTAAAGVQTGVNGRVRDGAGERCRGANEIADRR